MTVYVHKMEGQRRWFFGGYLVEPRASQDIPTDPWFVLTADTDHELQAMAASLGLTRVMFRPGKKARRSKKAEAAHYPITMGERDRALARGAQLISVREFHQMLEQRASRRGFS